jgi:hypothetical protein
MSTRKKSTGFVGLVGAPSITLIQNNGFRNGLMSGGFRASCAKYWGEGSTRQEAFAAWKEARDTGSRNGWSQ